MEPFIEVQRKRSMLSHWLYLALTVLPATGIFMFIFMFIFGGMFETLLNVETFLVTALVFAASYITWHLLTKLETKIDAEGVSVRYFPRELSQTLYPWSSFISADIITYVPVVKRKKIGGVSYSWNWGKSRSYVTKGYSYRLSGNEGLLLTHSNGNQLLIGTLKASELKAYLQMLKSMKIVADPLINDDAAQNQDKESNNTHEQSINDNTQPEKRPLLKKILGYFIFVMPVIFILAGLQVMVKRPNDPVVYANITGILIDTLQIVSPYKSLDPAVKLKLKAYPHVTFTCAIPFEPMEDRAHFLSLNGGDSVALTVDITDAAYKATPENPLGIHSPTGYSDFNLHQLKHKAFTVDNDTTAMKRKANFSSGLTTLTVGIVAIVLFVFLKRSKRRKLS